MQKKINRADLTIQNLLMYCNKYGMVGNVKVMCEELDALEEKFFKLLAIKCSNCNDNKKRIRKLIMLDSKLTALGYLIEKTKDILNLKQVILSAKYMISQEEM